MITGYRRYRIDLRGFVGDSILHGAHDEWHNREMQAKCGTQAEYEILAGLAKTPYGRGWNPHEMFTRCEQHLLAGECMCGIYVLKGPDMIRDYAYWPAIAAVTAWGAYTEFELGYRIQYARLEYVWIEPEWIEKYSKWSDVDVMLQLMKLRYGVPVEVRKSAVCCGQDHEMAFWPSNAGPISICKMETSHIVNCMKYLDGSIGRRNSYGAKWKMVFEKELERRRAKRIDGKTKVVF